MKVKTELEHHASGTLKKNLGPNSFYRNGKTSETPRHRQPAPPSRRELTVKKHAAHDGKNSALPEEPVRLLAIADPHLSSHAAKPMTIFGGNWAGHPEIFFQRWRETVLEDDVVIISGDISWGLKLPDAMPDLEMIAALPGQKILVRGNHDYWWPSIGKLRAALPVNMHALQHDSIIINDTAIIGTRGWTCPGNDDFDSDDEKIYARELERLKLAIASLKGKMFTRLIVALHYPPFNARFRESGFTELLETAQADAVIFGHLHGYKPSRLPKEWKGIPLHFVACDAVNFVPQIVLEQL
jgi:uncharacterized protein